ncbi:hypothetical protein ACH5RR_015990 [Cinchona calisaya]|uniref:Uncharacterized protein n=1 Tax=Cinchona calisaya TaxID=153742 RepID=A0ABD2ZUM6_9GENT
MTTKCKKKISCFDGGIAGREGASIGGGSSFGAGYGFGVGFGLGGIYGHVFGVEIGVSLAGLFLVPIVRSIWSKNEELNLKPAHQRTVVRLMRVRKRIMYVYKKNWIWPMIPPKPPQATSLLSLKPLSFTTRTIIPPSRSEFTNVSVPYFAVGIVNPLSSSLRCNIRYLPPKTKEATKYMKSYSDSN